MSKFEQDTAVIQTSDNQWQAKLHKGWRIGAVPNGGYVLSIIGRALSEALDHGDPMVINAFYLAPTVLGDAEISIEPLRSSRNTSHATARLTQDGELKVLATAVYTDLDTLSGPSWVGKERPEFPRFEDCEIGADSGLEFRQNVDLRLLDGVEVFQGGEPSGSGEFRGWIRHKDGANPDPISLLMFADAFPPPAFSVVGLVGWVPTVELTVQVRAKPAPGPVQARLYSRHATNGVVEEDGEYWDSEGRLVAISRQTAKVRIPRSD
ncbi:MAG: thioesterase family protein [Halieaceae bacterium]|nr:thioesterase family protein [Halieaceae bacterium]